MCNPSQYDLIYEDTRTTCSPQFRISRICTLFQPCSETDCKQHCYDNPFCSYIYSSFRGECQLFTACHITTQHDALSGNTYRMTRIVIDTSFPTRTPSNAPILGSLAPTSSQPSKTPTTSAPSKAPSPCSFDITSICDGCFCGLDRRRRLLGRRTLQVSSRESCAINALELGREYFSYGEYTGSCYIPNDPDRQCWDERITGIPSGWQIAHVEHLCNRQQCSSNDDCDDFCDFQFETWGYCSRCEDIDSCANAITGIEHVGGGLTAEGIEACRSVCGN